MQAISLSPSFNSHSNSKVAEIAARVVEEFASLELYDDEFYIDEEENPPTRRSEGGTNSNYVEYVEGENRDEDASDDDDEEFEFSFVTRDSELPSPISADDIFHNGQIRPVYPVFNRDLYLQSLRENGLEKGEKVRLPLKNLFSEERETAMTMKTTSSCSSSDADELDGVSEDLYCVWRPTAEGRCKKSSSAGSNSKRWKFKVKDLLLNRSHSEGSNEDFVILSGRKKQNEQGRGKLAPVSGGKTKSEAAPPLPPPPPPVYGGVKRRSYLPYRQDLVGIFPGVNGLGRTLQPF
ncbi:hypothetical protein SASPL_138531 [Salvia splendens]|uniref:Uncharacterized protein n=1 Tax=Salvia splendens TaxID=180675 RepID=A0A8X8ZDZ7_SALSN|nr:uncharacterized protein LOC121764403 [Salvia splendens]KAG6401667.1 hypothetical protein SASPL_138531 [Salvia splendens]